MKIAKRKFRPCRLDYHSACIWQGDFCGGKIYICRSAFHMCGNGFMKKKIPDEIEVNCEECPERFKCWTERCFF